MVRFWARVNSIEHHAAGSNETVPYAMNAYQDFLIDSGTTLSFLPSSVVAGIAKELGGTTQQTGEITVDCALIEEENNSGLVFKFEQGSIEVPYKNLIIDLRQISAGQAGCMLGTGEIYGVVGIDSMPVLGSE
jgi:hypothetical protein